MSPVDEAEFISLAEPLSDSVERHSEFQWFLNVGSCKIQLLRSTWYEHLCICGRIALRTSPDDPDSKCAESLFNKLRRWFKKNYENGLTVRNVNRPGSTTTCRTHWVGPDLIQELSGTTAPTLAQNRNAVVVFEIDNR